MNCVSFSVDAFAFCFNAPHSSSIDFTYLRTTLWMWCTLHTMHTRRSATMSANGFSNEKIETRAHTAQHTHAHWCNKRQRRCTAAAAAVTHKLCAERIYILQNGAASPSIDIGWIIIFFVVADARERVCGTRVRQMDECALCHRWNTFSLGKWTVSQMISRPFLVSIFEWNGTPYAYTHIHGGNRAQQ